MSSSVCKFSKRSHRSSSSICEQVAPSQNSGGGSSKMRTILHLQLYILGSSQAVSCKDKSSPSYYICFSTAIPINQLGNILVYALNDCIIDSAEIIFCAHLPSIHISSTLNFYQVDSTIDYLIVKLTLKV